MTIQIVIGPVRLMRRSVQTKLCLAKSTYKIRAFYKYGCQRSCHNSFCRLAPYRAIVTPNGKRIRPNVAKEEKFALFVGRGGSQSEKECRAVIWLIRLASTSAVTYPVSSSDDVRIRFECLRFRFDAKQRVSASGRRSYGTKHLAHSLYTYGSLPSSNEASAGQTPPSKTC